MGLYIDYSNQVPIIITLASHSIPYVYIKVYIQWLKLS